MSDWQQWKYINRYKIQHIVGYEEKFVDEILSQIPEITPNDVIAQYHFKDHRDGNRYIDFFILNEKKGYRLPIELDGYAKINNKTYEVFNDFLERQNDLIQKFGIVLRYSNKKAFDQQSAVIAEIRKALKDQSDQKINQQFKDQQTARLIQEYELKIAEYQKITQTNHPKDSIHHREELDQAIIGLNIFKNNHVQELQTVREELTNIKSWHQQQLNQVKRDMKKKTYFSVAAVAICAVGTMLYLNSSEVKQDDVTTSITSFNGQYPDVEPVNMQDAHRVDQQNEDIAPVIEEERVDDSPRKALQDKEDRLLELGPQKMDRSAENSRSSERPPAAEEVIIPDYIPVAEVGQYVGQTAKVCGEISQISTTSKATYINFGGNYPRQKFSAVIWNSHIGSFEAHDHVCISGVIGSYKGVPQIVVESVDSQISI